MVFLGLDSFEQGELPLDMIKPYIIYTNMIQASCSTFCILCVNMVFLFPSWKVSTYFGNSYGLEGASEDHPTINGSG
jgi:hypothetical protein